MLYYARLNDLSLNRGRTANVRTYSTYSINTQLLGLYYNDLNLYLHLIMTN